MGHDVVQLLQDAFDRKHLHVRCVALVNDVSRATLLTTYDILTLENTHRLWALCFPGPTLRVDVS